MAAGQQNTIITVFMKSSISLQHKSHKMEKDIENGFEENNNQKLRKRNTSLQHLFLNRKGLRSSILLILLLTLLNILHLVMQKVSETNFNTVLRKMFNYKKTNVSSGIMH